MAAPFLQPTLRPCRLATTANVASFAGGAPNPVDGVTPVAGDRIFALNQSDGTTAGTFRVVTPGSGSDGTWVRTDDCPYWATNILYPGSRIYISEGTQNGMTWVSVVNTGTITVGTTSLSFVQEALLMRTDASSTVIIAAATAFTAGTIVWSSAVTTRDYREVSIWLELENIGSNTQVDLFAQWSDDGATIPFDNNNGVQQTDFLLITGTDGTFLSKDYVPKITTAGGELVTGKILLLSYPKKGGSFRFGVRGNSATGTFNVRSQRLA